MEGQKLGTKLYKKHGFHLYIEIGWRYCKYKIYRFYHFRTKLTIVRSMYIVLYLYFLLTVQELSILERRLIVLAKIILKLQSHSTD